MSESFNTIVHKCLKALVTTSLSTSASCIVIRFHEKALRLLVGDNGEGLSPDDLGNIASEKNAPALRASDALRLFEKNVLALRAVTASIFVMSRYKDYDTVGQILTKDLVWKKSSIPRRAFPGTTVSLRFSRDKGDATRVHFHELKAIVGAFALNNPHVFFSLCDDEKKETIFRIRRQNETIHTLQTICNQPLAPEKIHSIQNERIRDRVLTGYFGYDCSREIIQRIFLNNEEVNCPEIKKIIITNYLKTVNSCGTGNGLHFSLKKEKILFLLYINSPDGSLQNLVEDEGFLETMELRIVRALFLQLEAIPLKDLRDNFLLKVNEPVTRQRKDSKKRKTKEGERPVLKKRFASDLKQVSLPLLCFTCNKFRPSTMKYQSSHKGIKGDSMGNAINEPKTTCDVEIISLIESPEDFEESDMSIHDGGGAHEAGVKEGNSWENSYDLEDLGEWSDWIYEGSESHEFNQQMYYNFLPQKLRPLLPVKQQLTRRETYDPSRDMGGLKWNRREHKIEYGNLSRRQDSHIRPCKNSQKKRIELTLEKSILKNMKVLNQVNKEFIAGVTQNENKKYLLIIDQHAMDERIRYEALLREYRYNQNTLSLSHLYCPLEISELPDEVMPLILTNSQVLKCFGVTFKQKSRNSVEVSTVPNCFLSKKCSKTANTMRSVKELIIEIGEKLIRKSGVKCLPIVIHNAIASEACHGAIRFGDVLNVNQCETLVSHWIETELPNRCAHGRPAVVPLMEINAYSRRHQKVFKEKLNFGSLRRHFK
ncbi:DNA mismatch repair protein MutL-like isoform X2 [Diachasmimorpha longicaudata]|uniref:DNA mismatch repair protein MutL-like isoform X2 n=1 Tax=Diachasmimorpha longicaudata TaxID=58733 RepID=UPI0030B8B45A